MLRILSAVVLATVAIGATHADASAPRYMDAATPTWKHYLANSGDHARYRGCSRPSDVHAYDGRNGRAFEQHRDRYGIYWTTRAGRVVASLYGRTFFNEARRNGIIVAAWCEG